MRSTGCSTDRHIPAIRLVSFTGRPDRGQIEPLGAADISVEHLADMQTEIHRRLTVESLSRGYQPGETERQIDPFLKLQDAIAALDAVINAEAPK